MHNGATGAAPRRAAPEPCPADAAVVRPAKKSVSYRKALIAPTGQSEAAKHKLRNPIALLKSKSWLVLLALPLLTTAAATSAAVLTPALYQTRSSLLVTHGPEYAFKPLFGEEAVLQPWKSVTVVNAELEILNSDRIKRSVIEKLGAARLVTPDTGGLRQKLTQLIIGDDREPPSDYTALKYMQRNFVVKGVLNSNVIHLEFKHPDPTVAALALSTLMDVYEDGRAWLYNARAADFLERQMAFWQRRLAEADSAVQTFRRENLALQREISTQVINDRETLLRTELDRVDRELAETKSLQANREIAAPGGTSTLQAINSRISGLQATKAALVQQIESATRMAASVNEAERDLALLQDKAEFARKSVDDLRQKLFSAQMNDKLANEKLTNVRVMDRPEVPQEPVGLPIATRAILAFLVGLLAALGIVLAVNRSVPQSAATLV